MRRLFDGVDALLPRTAATADMIDYLIRDYRIYTCEYALYSYFGYDGKEHICGIEILQHVNPYFFRELVHYSNCDEATPLNEVAKTLFWQCGEPNSLGIIVITDKPPKTAEAAMESSTRDDVYSHIVSYWNECLYKSERLRWMANRPT